MAHLLNLAAAALLSTAVFACSFGHAQARPEVQGLAGSALPALRPTPKPTCHEVSSSFGDHMVLQRAPERAVVYGTVCGGEWRRGRHHAARPWRRSLLGGFRALRHLNLNPRHAMPLQPV